MIDKHFFETFNQRVRFIKTQQEKEGNFIGLSFANSVDYTGAVRYKSIFLTALILDCLNTIPETLELKIIKDKAASFLMEQRSDAWSFNYWVRKSRESKILPYPDDLDDTFCVLASLFRYDSGIVDGKVMASIVQLLTQVEKKEGGPYRTWLVQETKDLKWMDVDVAVNSNIAYFLDLNDIHLPKVTAFIEQAIRKDKIKSPYYPSIYPIVYFISRFYRGKYVDDLQKLLLSQRDENHVWENPLYTALAVSSLLNLKTPADEVAGSIAYLMQSQKDNLWQPYAFCIDPSRDGKTFYAGSSALTTAFCLEAFAKYLQVAENVVVHQADTEKEELYRSIVQQTESSFAGFSTQFKSASDEFIQGMLQSDTKKTIALLPYYVSLSFNAEDQKKISDELLVVLGTANILGWLAYTIYDDFLDDEGDPTLLPIANAALRELTSLFESILPENMEFRACFHTIMDQLDEANAWEVANCRVEVQRGYIDADALTIPEFSDYEKLASKSIGHALGPIALLFSLGYTWKSSEVMCMLDFFTHYLIARQLNDDAHDWEKDLKMGHINPVSALLLKKVYATHIQGRKRVYFKDILPELQKVFWDEIIDSVCSAIFINIDKAKRSIGSCNAVADPTFFEKLLVKYEKSAQKALDEKKQAVQFLSEYTV